MSRSDPGRIQRAMILAAGRGERLRPLTDRIPKPLLTVAGKPLIVHHLEALRGAGVEEVVINLGWLGSCIRATLGDGRAWGLRIRYADEGARTLETGGGIERVLPLLGSAPFLVVSADVWLAGAAPYPTVLAADDLATLLLVPNPEHHRTGDFELAGSGRVHDRESGQGGRILTYGGIGLLHPALFEPHRGGRYPLVERLRPAVAAGRVGGTLYAGVWSDVGTPERLEAARRML